MRRLEVDGTVIDDASPCYVIAEIGHNHQGKVETAMEMFRAAKECGASAVKLQKRDNRSLYTASMYDKPYDNENSFAPTYGAHREALEFGKAEYQTLQEYAREIGVTFFATAFDLPSLDFLASLDMPAYKVASGDLRNTPLLEAIAKVGRPMFVSTGAATMDDVQRAYDTVMPINQQLGLLQCTAGYPCAFEELDLRVIETYRERFDVVVGLSAHDSGIAMAVAAYVLGGRVIEKHFTLNRSMKGTDHAFSLEPVGLRKMVRDLSRVRVALGDGTKRTYPTESAPYMKMGKGLVAKRKLPAGSVLRASDIAIKSPAMGLPPYELGAVIGRVLRQDLEADQGIDFAVLEETPDAGPARPATAGAQAAPRAKR